jgi:hypothetical protein
MAAGKVEIGVHNPCPQHPTKQRPHPYNAPSRLASRCLRCYHFRCQRHLPPHSPREPTKALDASLRRLQRDRSLACPHGPSPVRTGPRMSARALACPHGPLPVRTGPCLLDACRVLTEDVTSHVRGALSRPADRAGSPSRDETMTQLPTVPPPPSSPPPPPQGRSARTRPTTSPPRAATLSSSPHPPPTLPPRAHTQHLYPPPARGPKRRPARAEREA